MKTKHFTKVKEAEEGSVESQHIVNTLKNNGYRQLGSGTDATVWAKDSGMVIKIIMPDDPKDSTLATKQFKKFYEFCQKNTNVQCLPKFIPIQGKHYQEFKIGDKEYMQIAMEQLYRIPVESFKESMVWFLSDYAKNNTSWETIENDLSDINTWIVNLILDEELYEKYVNKFTSMDLREKAEYQLLYTVMRYLYISGNINKFGWDLHTENVMQRKNGTLVITDPWFTLNFEK